MTLEEIVQTLAQPGWRIVVVQDGYLSYELRGPATTIGSDMISQLGREGWLEVMPNGGTYVLSDAGRRAYLRSADELGDGKLIPPLPKGDTTHD